MPMLTAKQSTEGANAGRWYAVMVEGKGVSRRTGYCATGCMGHESAEEALAHHLQYQLDREADFWLERRDAPRACEMCGTQTTLRARLGRGTGLFVLCTKHQTTGSLQTLSTRRVAAQTAGATL
jgi:hypothetical protein